MEVQTTKQNKSAGNVEMCKKKIAPQKVRIFAETV